MAINYPLTFPIDNLKEVKLMAIQKVGLTRAVFSMQTQVVLHSGNSWGAEIVLPVMKKENADKWTSFILSLKGRYGTFYLYDPLAQTPAGSAIGSPLVDGANQLGYELLTNGWGADEEGLLLPGDKIQIGVRLYQVLNQVDSNSSGEATLDIWPNLRESPADEALIITERPQGIFRLAEEEFQISQFNEAHIFDISFKCVEAI